MNEKRDSIFCSKVLLLLEQNESDTLDFKESYLNERGNWLPSKKRKFAKDISGFANTCGGHLIIGVKEIETKGKKEYVLKGVNQHEFKLLTFFLMG